MTAGISYDACADNPEHGTIGITAPWEARPVLQRLFVEPYPDRSDGQLHAARRGTAAECSRLIADLAVAGLDCEWLVDERPTKRLG